MKEELDDLYVAKVWSDISGELKDQLKEKVKNNLLSCNWKVNFLYVNK